MGVASGCGSGPWEWPPATILYNQSFKISKPPICSTSMDNYENHRPIWRVQDYSKSTEQPQSDRRLLVRRDHDIEAARMRPACLEEHLSF